LRSFSEKVLGRGGSRLPRVVSGHYLIDIEEKVLEKLATGDKATIVVERQSDGKMRVTSGSWDGEKVILRDQVLEVRNVEGGCTSRESLCTTDKGNPAD
jgi:hypothetical protein